ncbi:carbohydrate ABC transporter permease [Paenibacillus harenae]|uniref:Aldouronate transport system permease protein n=1 Tax=Paenibacillus harenae TaxID=306543 RepID=A0ABT9TXT1_PAEHA|nr:carbohydrate ABC transporter permease [Paenibacillus harenae]MDQ0112170.1 putative aldouronate transport system permease protein [Paenibacillus harenae]
MKPTLGENIAQTLIVIFITLLCVVTIYPFIHLASVSLSSPAEASRFGFHLYPKDIDLTAWNQVVSQKKIWIGFGNSVFRTVVGTFLTLIAMSLCAYPLSRKYLPHRSFYTMVILFTMFFGGGIVPTYLLIKWLGLMNSVWVYILPGIVPTFSMLVLRNFFMSIPAELEESAKIDGANDIRILFGIVLPLSKPVLATLALWTAVGHWNAWFDAVLYISDQSKQVLQFFLREIVITNADAETLGRSAIANVRYEASIKAATVMFAVLPILIVYPFLQKYFVKGTMIGSLKG